MEQFPTDIQRPRSTCDCAEETQQMSRAIAAYTTTTAPPSMSQSSSTNVSTASPGTSFDQVLGAGRMLVQRWDSINACPDASRHQEAALLHCVVDAAGHLLMLYESAARRVLNGIGTTEYSRPLRLPSFSNPYPIGGGSESHRDDTPVFLGNLKLEGEEAVVVTREALRNAMLRLSEVMHNVKEDSSDRAGSGWVKGNAYAGEFTAEDDAKLRSITSRLLRLLGKINSAT
ncbi:hypothetical protein GGR56DRAFT_661467 [Xylariaceae sp. FL0804]|nr:hypothetical protein GGR56DRAFT_661467 [Xylariaceae sp. FL0804]